MQKNWEIRFVAVNNNIELTTDGKKGSSGDHELEKFRITGISEIIFQEA